MGAAEPGLVRCSDPNVSSTLEDDVFSFLLFVAAPLRVGECHRERVGVLEQCALLLAVTSGEEAGGGGCVTQVHHLGALLATKETPVAKHCSLIMEQATRVPPRHL